MRDRSSRLARALVVAGASLFIVVGAVFGANALTTLSHHNDPASTSGSPASTTPPQSTEPAETAEPAGTAEPADGTEPDDATEPADTTESGEAPDPAATNGTDSGGQNQEPGDTDGNDGQTDGD